MYDDMNAHAIYGLGHHAPPAAHYDVEPDALAGAVVTAKDAGRAVWHPDHPLFWLAALTLATAGFIGVSASGRLGPAKAGVSLGKS